MTQQAQAPAGSSDAIEAMMRPRRVAVIGASSDPSRIGGRPIDYMQRLGFEGEIWPVNPSRAEIQGLRCYSDIASLPEAPDVAIIAVPGAAAVDAAAALARRGTKAAIVFSAGFAEVGSIGLAEQDRLLSAAHAGGMRVLGPNSLGVFNARMGFFGTFSASIEGGAPLPGNIAIVSQSGAYGSHLFSLARNRRIGTPLLAATGNESDISVGELLAWTVRDAETDVIALYVEGIRKADDFVAGLAAAHAARTPVVIMKVGRSQIGQIAAQSHTASIAGDDAVFDAVLAEFGVVRAETTDQMLDIVQLAARKIYPVSNTLGVITVSGGAGVMVSDVAESLDLPLPPMPEGAQATLRSLLSYASPNNPVDCTAQALNDVDLVGAFTETLVAEGGYKSVLAFFSQTGGSPTFAPKLRAALKAVRDRHPERLYVLSVIAGPDQVAGYEADGFSVFEDPSRAVVAINAMGRFGDAFVRNAPKTPYASRHVALPQRTPNEAEAKAWLAEAGLAMVSEQVCTTVEGAEAAADQFGFPVVMKILSPDILHKSEIGGVLIGVGDKNAVRDGFATLLRRASVAKPDARVEGVLVAKQLKGIAECIVGIHRDPVFGPVAMFGLGGIFVEILKDVAFRRCPFDAAEAERMIDSTRGSALLRGARGRPRADIGALAQFLSRLSQVAATSGERLTSIDLNPVLAMPEGEGAFAVDALIEVVPQP